MKHFVKDWMTKKPLRVTVDEDVDFAAELMRRQAVGHILVMDERRLTGILSTQDLVTARTILKRFPESDALNVSLTVGDLMGRTPKTISSKATIAEAATTMHEIGIHCLPVTDDDGEICGIITSTDLMKYALIASQRLDAEDMLSKAAREA